jgi:cytidylate kinase
MAASKVAAIPGVRAALLEFQRRFALSAPGAVLDGRDIGTVVCPDATAKLFVTADVETRARRRHAELCRQSEGITFDTVLEDLVARDRRDIGRAVAPLKPAPDADLLDTSNLSIEAAVAAAIDLISARLVKS